LFLINTMSEAAGVTTPPVHDGGSVLQTRLEDVGQRMQSVGLNLMHQLSRLAMAVNEGPPRRDVQLATPDTAAHVAAREAEADRKANAAAMAAANDASAQSVTARADGAQVGCVPP